MLSNCPFAKQAWKSKKVALGEGGKGEGACGCREVSRSLIAVSPEVASLSAHSDGWTPLAIPDTLPCKTLDIKAMTFPNDSSPKSLQDIKS